MNSRVWIAWITLDCTSAHMLGHNFHFTGCFDIKLRWLSDLPNTYEKRCLEVDSSIRSVCWYMWTLKVLLSSIIALFTCMYDMISHLLSTQSAAVFLFISFKARLAAFDCGNCVIVFICCNNLGKPCVHDAPWWNLFGTSYFQLFENMNCSCHNCSRLVFVWQYVWQLPKWVDLILSTLECLL